jgi:uncharacterized membrane protein
MDLHLEDVKLPVMLRDRLPQPSRTERLKRALERFELPQLRPERSRLQRLGDRAQRLAAFNKRRANMARLGKRSQKLMRRVQREISCRMPDNRNVWLAVGAGAVLAAGTVLLVRRARSRQTMGDQVSVPHDEGLRVDQAMTFNLPAAELYAFWRRLDNLPRFMRHLESVDVIDDRRSRWVAVGPAGTRVEWEAEIINDIPNERIGWRSLPESTVDNAGSVQFRPLNGGRGTMVIVEMKYDPPAGKAGAAVARLFGRDAATEVREDLLRLKMLLESGEMPLAGQTAGASQPARSAGQADDPGR